MPQSLANVIIHLVFSTKDRRAFFDPDIRAELHAYLAAVARNAGCDGSRVGGTADHVHLLFILPATQSLAATVQKLKGSSSHWMGKDFSWQEGYGAFSVSPSQVAVVKTYIRGQEQHHRKLSFQDEFRLLLKRYELAYDERYVWD